MKCSGTFLFAVATVFLPASSFDTFLLKFSVFRKVLIRETFQVETFIKSHFTTSFLKQYQSRLLFLQHPRFTRTQTEISCLNHRSNKIRNEMDFPFLCKTDRNKLSKVFTTIKLKSFSFYSWRELREVTIIDSHFM